MDMIDSLRRVPLFVGFPEKDLQRIAQVARRVALEPKQTVYAEGEKVDSLFIVEFGSVRVLKSGSEGNEEIRHLGRGSRGEYNPSRHRHLRCLRGLSRHWGLLWLLRHHWKAARHWGLKCCHLIRSCICLLGVGEYHVLGQLKL